MKAMAESGPPGATLLVRAGGVRGLVYTALPVTTFAVTNSIAGLVTAIIAAVGVASIVLVWQLVRRESVRRRRDGLRAAAARVEGRRERAGAAAWSTGQLIDVGDVRARAHGGATREVPPAVSWTDATWAPRPGST